MDERFELLKKYNFWGENRPELGFLRTAYTEKIHSYIGNRLTKILVGQRRSGKSYILRQIAASLIDSGVNPQNTFFINKEFTDFDFIETYKDLDSLFKLYKEQLQPQGRIYLFIDEIQNITGWEHLVNSLSQDYMNEYELFISGSNSKMLSSELATLLAGRFIEFRIYPLSFEEYISITSKECNRQSYMDYMQSGGLPELCNLKSEESRRGYIEGVKDTVILRDIINRHSIKDPILLNKLFTYIVNNASNLLSIRNISNYIKSSGHKTSYDTVALYISYLEETFVIHKAEKYNIKGKETIGGSVKFYVNDLSFKNYLYKGYGYGSGYLLENLVYLNLLQHGYNIYVGNINNKEIDFVAMKDDRVIYLQASYMLIDKETIEREYSVLESIRDNYEKYVISLDDIALPSRNGIRNIPAWELSGIL